MVNNPDDGKPARTAASEQTQPQVGSRNPQPKPGQPIGHPPEFHDAVPQGARAPGDTSPRYLDNEPRSPDRARQLDMVPRDRFKVDDIKKLFHERTGRDASDGQVLEAVDRAGTKDTITETNAAIQRELERLVGIHPATTSLRSDGLRHDEQVRDRRQGPQRDGVAGPDHDKDGLVRSTGQRHERTT